MQINTLKFRNFLSYGNDWTMIDFSALPKITAVVGQSGAGKSTIFDAIFFALFGKPMRSINKGELVNKTNGKGLEVALTFVKGGKQYLVERGIKPNFLRVHIDGEQLPSENLSDMQKTLDTVIGVDPTTIKQLLLISHGQRVPFFRLSKGERRKFLDENLGLDKLTEGQKEVKRLASSITQEISLLESKVSVYDSQIREIEQKIERAKRIAGEEIEAIQSEIEKWKEKEAEVAKAKFQCSDKLADAEDKLEKIRQKESEIRSELVSLQRQLKEYEASDICPACGRPFDDKHLGHIRQKREGLLVSIEKKQKALEKCEETKKTLMLLASDLRGKVQKCMDMGQFILSKKSELKSRLSMMQKASSENDLQEHLDGIIQERKEIVVKIQQKKKQLDIVQKAVHVFGDDGVKKLVLQQVVPLLEQKTGEYAVMLGIGCRIEFDTMLGETIHIAGKKYTYEALSDGERMRLDIALSFAWHWLLSSMNELSFDVVFLDEITANLDVQNVEIFKDFLYELPMRFVLITHNNVLQDAIDTFIEVSKSGGFSSLEIH